MIPSIGRRSFLRYGAVAAGATVVQFSQLACAGEPSAGTEAVALASSSSPLSSPAGAVHDFSRSFLHCAPNKSGIWVRIQMECFCRLVDRASGRSDEYALGVVAKTGAQKDPKTGVRGPGYDYWLIFSKDRVYTRRTHASVYGRNPTELTEAEFGKFGWHLEPVSATRLKSPDDIRQALQSWKRLVARTEFSNADGSRAYVVEYPVKWADCGEEPIVIAVPKGTTIPMQSACGTNVFGEIGEKVGEWWRGMTRQ